MVTLISEPNTFIHVSDMQDGEIAIIGPQWSCGACEGIIIQRHKDIFIPLGMHSSKIFGPFLNKKDHPQCLVRILPPGSLLQV